MRIIKILSTTILLLGCFASPSFAADLHWTGASGSEFQSASNWIDASTGTTASNYPGQNDNIFFSGNYPVTTKAITSASFTVNSITCTDSSPYTVNVTTMNVYGDISLNGNLTFTGNRTLNMLGSTFNTLNLGGVAHAITLNIDKPGGGITSLNHIDLNRTSNGAGLASINGDFSISGFNITTTRTVKFGSSTTTTSAPRTFNLTNCTITTTYAGGTISGMVDANEFMGTNTTYNITNCNLIFSNPRIYFRDISVPVQLNSLTLKSNTTDTNVLVAANTTLDINTLNLDGNPQLDLDNVITSTSYSLTCNINTLNFNVPTLIRAAASGTTPKTLNIGSINESTLNCRDKASFNNITLNATGSQINTSNITYQGCVFGGFGFEASDENDVGNNSGSISWTNSAGTRYYWIGGNGNWSDPTKWSYNSSGSPANSSSDCVPTAIDTVYFDPATAGTVTLPVTAACRAIYWTGTGTGGQMNRANGSTLSIFGDANFSGANSINVPLYFPNKESAGNFILKSGSATTYTQPLYFSHQGTYTFTGDFISSSSITLNSGNIVATGINMNFSYLDSRDATNVRSLDLSGSTIVATYATGDGLRAIYLNAMNLTLNVSGTDITLTSNNAGLRIDNSFPVAPAFHNVTFSDPAGTGTLTLQSGASYDNLTFNGNGSMNAAGSFSVGNLTLAPLKTFIFANGSNITITGSLNPRTGMCSSITLTNNSGTGRATIVNNTGNPMSIPGGKLRYIGYTKGSDNTNLQVPNGENTLGSDITTIDFTPRTPQTFYWIGGMGAWEDPANWAIGDSTDISGITNLDACLPIAVDTVYFTGYSFDGSGQTVTTSNPISFVSMIWTPAAGAWSPELNLYGGSSGTQGVVASGFIEFTTGVKLSSSNPVYINFTGNSLVQDAQKFDTRGVTYQSSSLRWVLAFNTGRYDWYGSFPVQSFMPSNCDFYTHGSTLNGMQNSRNITQTSGRTVDISNSTFTGGWQTITISDCTKFNGEGAVFRSNVPTTFNNNDPNCTANFASYEGNSSSANDRSLISNGTSLVHFEKTIFATGQISGKIEVDSLFLTTRRGTLTIGIGADTVKILQDFIYPGTPCDEFNVKSSSEGVRANLQLPACNRRDYFLYVQDIEAILPDVCTPTDVWTVYGLDMGNNSANIDFLPAPNTTINTNKTIVACKPYHLVIPGASDAATISNTAWTVNGTPLPGNNGALSLEVWQDGIYEVFVTYNSLSTGCTTIFSDTINFVDTFVWTADANSTDWNDPNNWDQLGVPDACSYVIIPGKLGYYPILEEEDVDLSIPAAVCDTIEFQFGGEVKNTNYLTYNAAKVEMEINSNQWYMLSAPLRNTYSGDFYIDNPNPHADLNGRGMLTYMMQFGIVNPQTGYFKDYNWTNAFNTNDVELQPGRGFALFANPKDSDYDEQYEIGDSFWFPKNDPFHYYWSILGAITGRGDDLDRTYNGRFIYESVIDPATGLVPLAHSSLEKDSMVLVGNPFMAHLDFDAFVADNTSLIWDEYKIAFGNTNDGSFGDFSSYKKIGGSHYTSSSPSDTLPRYIAPMQSFVVYSRGTSSNFLQADIVNHTSVAPIAINSPLRSPAQYDIKQLFITAKRGVQKSSASLVVVDGTSPEYLAEEDSRKLFDEKATSPVLVYLRSKDGVALDINATCDLSEMIPIGIRTSKTGRIVLNFLGMEEFVDQKIYFHDIHENRVIDLSEQDEYAFIKYDTDLFIENRFYFSFEDITGINNMNMGKVSVFSPAPRTIQVFSNNGQMLDTIEIADIQGRTLVKEYNISKSVYNYRVPSPGVYIVRVMGETRKVITK